MNDMRTLIVDTANRIFRDHCAKQVVDEAEQGIWPAALWQTLEEAGLTRAAVPEDAGGAGGTLGDACAVLREAGRHAAPVPLAEGVLAGWLLSTAGLPVPDGPLAVAAGSGLELDRAGDGWRLRGEARRVAWGGDAKTIAVLAGGPAQWWVAAVDRGSGQSVSGRNLAGEPRDRITFDNVALTDDQVRPAGPGVDGDRLRRLGALTRAQLMAGAIEWILETSVRYSLDRVQFGRPIGKFQAVQQQLAVLAGQTAAAGKAAELAVAAVETGDGAVEIAVAKARVGEAAGIAAEVAHQVHGAMGFTHEHPLHQRTRRLWAWRDEYGGEAAWQAELGRQIAKRGADGLWTFISGT